MRAVVSAELGAAPSVTELETPTPGPGEVRVKVRASSLNGFDTAVVAGWMAGYMEHRFPVVLGRDFAGTVDLVGADVDGFGVGDPVFGVVLSIPLQAGGFGEYVIVPHASLARVPSGMDLTTAGVIGLAGSAAAAVIDTVSPREGETILVSGATGGVGNIIIQLAAARGATVIATAGQAEGVELVTGLGASHVLDFTGDLAAQLHAVAIDGVDIAVHLAGDPFALADLVRPGGRFATLLGIPAEQFGERDLVAHSVVAAPHADQLERLARKMIAGDLVIPVQRAYRLDDVPQAFADFAGGTLGKLAVHLH
jgi:NADPH2:quinone reductase